MANTKPETNTSQRFTVIKTVLLSINRFSNSATHDAKATSAVKRAELRQDQKA